MSNGVRTKSEFCASPEVVTTNALSIERDFRGLIETLGRTIDMLDPSDDDLRERLVNTKAVAERGHRLSKLLLKATRKRRS
jgi:hypothetical protein